MKTNAGRNQNLSVLLLRAALALAFLYAAIASFKNPLNWENFLPTLLTKHFRADVLLKFFSVYELLLAAWLLSGKYVRYAGLLSAATLLGVVASNVHAFDLTFRDLALALTGLALFFAAEK